MHFWKCSIANPEENNEVGTPLAGSCFSLNKVLVSKRCYFSGNWIWDVKLASFGINQWLLAIAWFLKAGSHFFSESWDLFSKNVNILIYWILEIMANSKNFSFYLCVPSDNLCNEFLSSSQNILIKSLV